MVPHSPENIGPSLCTGIYYTCVKVGGIIILNNMFNAVFSKSMPLKLKYLEGFKKVL